MATDLEIAWAAGFLEGEGSFHRWKNKGRDYARIKVSQVDREPLERLRELFDGPICLDGGPRRARDNPGRQTMWYWSLTGHRAEKVLLAVQPYMSARRKVQILGALTPASGNE